MIRRPASCLGSNPIKPQLAEIEFVHKDIDHPNGIVLVDPVLQVFRKQRTLSAIRPLNEALHPIPRSRAPESLLKNHTKHRVFTQPGSIGDLPDVRAMSALPLKADIDRAHRDVGLVPKADTGA